VAHRAALGDLDRAALLRVWVRDQLQRLEQALEKADVPRFLLFAAADRLAFFSAWAWLSATALRRFVANVPIASDARDPRRLGARCARSAIRSRTRPMRSADAAVRGRLDAVIASALIPSICHFTVMLVQMTIALPLQRVGADRAS